MGLSDGRKSFRIGLAVLIQYRSVTASHPATQPRCRSYYALCYRVEPNNLKHLTFHVDNVDRRLVAKLLRSAELSSVLLECQWDANVRTMASLMNRRELRRRSYTAATQEGAPSNTQCCRHAEGSLTTSTVSVAYTSCDTDSLRLMATIIQQNRKVVIARVVNIDYRYRYRYRYYRRYF